jgi:hypothetical protein
VTDASPSTTAEPALDPRRWKAMPVIALAVSIIIMDATVVNVVLPVLIRDINLTASDAEWINSVYAQVFASLLITVTICGGRVRTARRPQWCPLVEPDRTRVAWLRQRDVPATVKRMHCLPAFHDLMHTIKAIMVATLGS